MDDEQQRVLSSRFQEAAARQPEIILLRELLLGLGGTHLVAAPAPDADLRRLIEAGFVMSGPVVRRTMRGREACRSVAKIWIANPGDLVGIGTGYSLSNDGLWRQHAWGVRRQGLLETTVPRVQYFGLLLQYRTADAFAQMNL